MKNVVIYMAIVIAFLFVAEFARADLLGYWSFDGDMNAVIGGWGSSTVEYGPNGSNDYTFVADAPTNIVNTQSIDFGSANDDVILTGLDAQSAALDGANPVFSIAFWFKSTGGVANSKDMVALCNGVTMGGGEVVWIDFDMGGTSIYTFYNNGNTVAGSITPTDGAWHHLALTYNATHGDSVFYYDGVDQTTSIKNPANILTLPTDNTLSVGGTTGPIRQISNVRIADLAIWNEILTPSMIADLADGNTRPAIPPPTGTLIYIR